MLKPKRNTLPPHAAAWLAQRTVEVGDCLIWTRCTNGERHPVASFGGKSRARPVRRWLFEQMNGGPPPAGYKVLCTCADARCVKPGHLVAATPSELNDWINRAGRVNEATRRAACTRNARARSKLTIEIVRGMRADRAAGMLLREIGAKWGVSETQASRICRGDQWRDQADPFAGLRMAA